MPSCLLFLWACLQIIRCMVSTTHSPLHVVVKPQPLRLNNEVGFKMPKTSVPLMSTVLEDGSKSQYTLNLLLFKSLNRTLWLCWCLILLLIKLLVSSGKTWRDSLSCGALVHGWRPSKPSMPTTAGKRNDSDYEFFMCWKPVTVCTALNTHYKLTGLPN